jgi:hypothetical protein
MISLETPSPVINTFFVPSSTSSISDAWPRCLAQAVAECLVEHRIRDDARAQGAEALLIVQQVLVELRERVFALVEELLPRHAQLVDVVLRRPQQEKPQAAERDILERLRRP